MTDARETRTRNMDGIEHVLFHARERDFINQVNTSKSVTQQSLKWRAASGGNCPSMLAAHYNQHSIFKIMTEKKH